MRTYLLLTLASVSLFLGSSCNRQPEPPKQTEPEYRATGTIKDLMDSMVDPSADFLWDSVATTVSAKGIEDKAPHTDAEWAEVRRRAITLLEATNLLLMPGRHVAKPGEKADDPKVELAPEQIEQLINQDRKVWTDRAHALHDSAMASLKAIEAKNAEELLNSGDGIDQACENCHLVYWYPDEAKKLKDVDKQQQKQ